MATLSLRHSGKSQITVAFDGEKHHFTNLEEAFGAALFNAWYHGLSITIAPSIIRMLNGQYGQWTNVIGDKLYVHNGFQLTER